MKGNSCGFETGNLRSVDKLIDYIRQIPNTKIVTLSIDDEKVSSFDIDVDDHGAFGYEKGHLDLFRAKLLTAFRFGGGMVIRQFLHLKNEYTNPEGKKVWIPQKNIYGVLIQDGKWHPLPKDEMRVAFTTDAQTGQRLPGQDDLLFPDPPDPSTDSPPKKT
jgi:hypothetical protein